MKFDIIFLSFNESNADRHWLELRAKFPGVRRVHGVRGIAEAHLQAAEKSTTDFFFVVDGDNRLVPGFRFDPPAQALDQNTLYVWRCRNPVNQLVYGYGAIKLYSKSLLNSRHQKPFVDLATTLTEKYQIVDQLASETWFFNTPEEAWRGAFRECAKLASQCVARQKSDETMQRLKQWSHVNEKMKNAEWVKLGALEGEAYGREHPDQIDRINDFNWLKERFFSKSSGSV